jgi:hypothetical protein
VRKKPKNDLKSRTCWCEFIKSRWAKLKDVFFTNSDSGAGTRVEKGSERFKIGNIFHMANFRVTLLT